ncbi:phosphoglucosamine mutase [Thermodesulfobacteriota bacterium]
MTKLFGTDGIRGVANTDPMTPEMGVKVGRAVAYYFNQEELAHAHIVIGKDTRISGDMLEQALAAGICAMGVDVQFVDVLPTPGIAYLTAQTKAVAGVVISASHNPFYDNGIKIFNSDGYKLTEAAEEAIESLIFDDRPNKISAGIQKTGRTGRIAAAVQTYAAFLSDTFPKNLSLQGLKVVIDCSNGATHAVAPMVFKTLGAAVETLFAEPSGTNINYECGSQHPQALAQAVIEKGGQIGLAFDGDGDRLVAVAENGHILTGDQVLAIVAKYLYKTGALEPPTVVSTVMSNMGLGKTLQKMNIAHVQAQVGDRHVMEQMQASGAIIGGEDSGHLIFHKFHTTGDGILAALRLLEAMLAQKKTLSELSASMQVYPQIMINVDVAEKPDIESMPSVVEVIAQVEEQLGIEGRVLVRYSGTQPQCRVMVEGPTQEITNRYCNQIAKVVKKEIGL